MKTYADNKKAKFNYEILEEYEAGIELLGPEVKSIRAGHISLKEAFITTKAGELFLTNAHISPYKPARDNNAEPTRPRKLLLKKSEITKLIGKAQAEGNTMVPFKVYDSHGKIKIGFGLARGKKKYDKREAIKKREGEREIMRALKNN
jgi:SsrA-binding protein